VGNLGGEEAILGAPDDSGWLLHAREFGCQGWPASTSIVTEDVRQRVGIEALGVGLECLVADGTGLQRIAHDKAMEGTDRDQAKDP
jgi:hypothetical protein